MATLRNLPLITGNQNGYVSHNTALEQIAALSFGRIVADNFSDPSLISPAPSAHSIYTLSANGVGAWAGYLPNDIAYRNDTNGWVRYTPNNGLVLYSEVTSSLMLFDGSSWVAVGGSGGSGGGTVIELVTAVGDFADLGDLSNYADGTTFIVNGASATDLVEVVCDINNLTVAAMTIHVIVINTSSVVYLTKFNTPSGLLGADYGWQGSAYKNPSNGVMSKTLTLRNTINGYDGYGDAPIASSGQVYAGTMGVNDDILIVPATYITNYVPYDASFAASTGTYQVRLPYDQFSSVGQSLFFEIIVYNIPVGYTICTLATTNPPAALNQVGTFAKTITGGIANYRVYYDANNASVVSL